MIDLPAYLQETSVADLCCSACVVELYVGAKDSGVAIQLSSARVRTIILQ
jgi:hypothetical protein